MHSVEKVKYFFMLILVESNIYSLLSDSFGYQAYVNTELYARVSVAVLFYKLADLAEMVGSEKETDDCCAALELGKLFLLELLDSAVLFLYYPLNVFVSFVCVLKAPWTSLRLITA